MKQAHRPDLFVWSHFDTTRNLDFHAYALIRKQGNVLIDPLPLSEHDRQHLASLGGAKQILITNSDHTRAAQALAQEWGAVLCGPRAEREAFPFPCESWLGEGDEPTEGLRVFEMSGSKTPGELALVLDETTLIAGDLIRSNMGGQLALLPDAKLRDHDQALASVARIVREYPHLDAVLIGDGWPIFRDAAARLHELLQSQASARHASRVR